MAVTKWQSRPRRYPRWDRQLSWFPSPSAISRSLGTTLATAQDWIERTEKTLPGVGRRSQAQNFLAAELYYENPNARRETLAAMSGC